MKTANAMLMCLVTLVFTGTSMLAMSIDHFYLVSVAGLAICLSLIFTDWLKWLSIDGWLANSISLLILLFALRNFFDTDSAGKLISVAKLLVYLQAVLLFQKKTARLTWQIMVLSLLQVVVTTIFSVNFEGGLLFAVFFVAGCMALYLQNALVNSQVIESANEHSAERFAQLKEDRQGDDSKLAWWRSSTAPVTTFETPAGQQKFSLSQIGTFPALGFVVTLFTLILFLTAPRHVQPWFSPITYKVVALGISNSVDPYETGKVEQSSERVMRASFLSDKGDEVTLAHGPYFRGTALSHLKIEDGRTQFTAPYERIYSEHYEGLPEATAGELGRIVNVEITVEQSSNPVVYAVSPAFRGENTPLDLNFCHEVSALTRCRQGQEIAFAPFSYEFKTLINLKNEPVKYWPYIANNGARNASPMSNDPSQFEWLTWMEKERYPTLVRIADRIAREVRQSGGDRRDLVRKLEDHFLTPSNYSYTLDYTNVERNGDIDPIEDFVANFKQGHCSAFASAMVLMLRSQNIPARMVVGFHSGEYNGFSSAYIVRGKHAHAWVEVYLRPEDCSDEMKRTVECDESGAWLIADPTPPQPDFDDGLGTDDAIDLARTVWQDYVLGMESDQEAGGEAPMTMSVARLLQALNLDQLPTSIENLGTSDSMAILRPVLVVGIIFAIFAGFIRYLILSAAKEDGPEQKVGRIRRMLADAIGLISNDLREWLIGYNAETAFYKRFADVLEKHEMVRSPQQTHREFAQAVCEKLSSHPSRDEISASVQDVTELFNRVRFGGKPLEAQRREAVDARIELMDKLLRAGAAV